MGRADYETNIEAFEANNLEFENVYNEDDERREYINMVHLSGSLLTCKKVLDYQ